MNQKTYSKSPNRNPSNEAVRGTHGQSLEDIRPPADTTINSNGNLASSSNNALSQSIKSGRNTIQLTTTMVGHDDTIKAVLDGKLDVLGAVHPFDPQLQLGMLAQPGDRRVPVERRVKVVLARAVLGFATELALPVGQQVGPFHVVWEDEVIAVLVQTAT